MVVVVVVVVVVVEEDESDKVWKGQTEVNQRPMVDEVGKWREDGMDPRKGRWKGQWERERKKGLGKRKRKERMGRKMDE